MAKTSLKVQPARDVLFTRKQTWSDPRPALFASDRLSERAKRFVTYEWIASKTRANDTGLNLPAASKDLKRAPISPECAPLAPRHALRG
jgi:hypothetical protein